MNELSLMFNLLQHPERFENTVSRKELHTVELALTNHNPDLLMKTLETTERARAAQLLAIYAAFDNHRN